MPKRTQHCSLIFSGFLRWPEHYYISRMIALQKNGWKVYLHSISAVLVSNAGMFPVTPQKWLKLKQKSILPFSILREIISAKIHSRKMVSDKIHPWNSVEFCRTFYSNSVLEVKVVLVLRYLHYLYQKTPKQISDKIQQISDIFQQNISDIFQQTDISIW